MLSSCIAHFCQRDGPTRYPENVSRVFPRFAFDQQLQELTLPIRELFWHECSPNLARRLILAENQIVAR